MVLLLAPLLPMILFGHRVGGTGVVGRGRLRPAVPFRLLLGTAVASVITLGHARRLVRWELIRLVAVGVAAAVGAWIGLVQATALVSMMTILSLTQVHRQAARLGGEAPPWCVACRRVPSPCRRACV